MKLGLERNSSNVRNTRCIKYTKGKALQRQKGKIRVPKNRGATKSEIRKLKIRKLGWSCKKGDSIITRERSKTSTKGHNDERIDANLPKERVLQRGETPHSRATNSGITIAKKNVGREKEEKKELDRALEPGEKKGQKVKPSTK